MPRYVCRPGHPKASKWGFVDVNDIGPEPELATNAPIMAGRFYENIAMTDGTDVGSRKKYREYLKRTGSTPASDFKDHWAKAEAQRNSYQTDGAEHRERRETIGRAWHETRQKRH